MNRRRLTSIVLTLAGVGLLVGLVYQTGTARIAGGFKSVGWGFAGILALSFARFFLRSFAWATLLPASVPLRATIAATISGDAIGNVTPLGLAASEPAKSVYLSAHMPPAQSFAALTAENFFYSISVALYISVSGIALLAAFPLDATLRLAGIIVLAAMGVVLVGSTWVALRQPTLLSAIIRRVPSSRIASVLTRVQQFEVETYRAARITGARLARLIAAEVVFHFLSFLEAWYTLWLLTGRSAPLAALVLDGVNRFIKAAFKVIPMGVGVDQAAAIALAQAVSVPPDQALTLALVRFLRLIVWAAVGFAIWTRTGARRTANDALPGT
jgi:hypothetical protein